MPAYARAGSDPAAAGEESFTFQGPASDVFASSGAAFHLASLVAGRFSGITTLARSVAPIEHNLVK